MTLQINANDLTDAIEIATWVGSLVAMLVVGLIIYLMVRPPRRPKVPQTPVEPIESEELLRVVEMMERRLDLLERSVANTAEERKVINETGGDARQMRRMK
jgi:hypothetical protein